MQALYGFFVCSAELLDGGRVLGSSVERSAIL
jgi:hypothetical protein